MRERLSSWRGERWTPMEEQSNSGWKSNDGNERRSRGPRGRRRKRKLRPDDGVIVLIVRVFDCRNVEMGLK